MLGHERVLSYHRSFRPIDVLTTVRPHVWHVAGLAASFVILSAPGMWTRSHGRLPSYVPATIAFALLLTIIALWWPRAVSNSAPPRGWPSWYPLLFAAAGCVVLADGAWRWMGEVLTNPIDPNRADMLPVIGAVLGRVLKGHNPYAIYHVPWEAPLGYGPVLWLPYFVPYLLHADLRFVTILGALVLPIWSSAAAVVHAMRRDVIGAATWLILTVTILANPDLTYFMTVGHTPSYWPLLPLFAVLATAERWKAAALVLGLIVVGRSTMAAAVPIFLMGVWVNDRPAALRALLLFAAPIVVLMGPFAIWDPHALWYGMVAVYPHVIKQAVWSVPDGAIAHTIGVTGWLVSHHLERFVEATQVVLVVAVWIAGWFAIRRGARPLPWMGLATLAFCMTTLWPLYYIYFDVLLLFVSGAVAESIVSTGVRAPAKWWLAGLAAAACLVAAAVLIAAPPNPRIDFAAADASRWLYQGFATSRADGEPALPWIWGQDGTVALPRRSTASSAIIVEANPVVPAEGAMQKVTAFLNGRPLGSVDAARGWQRLRFNAPSFAWLIGANELKLVCAVSNSPILIGMSDDPRHLSLAIRRIEVVPETAANNDR